MKYITDLLSFLFLLYRGVCKHKVQVPHHPNQLVPQLNKLVLNQNEVVHHPHQLVHNQEEVVPHLPQVVNHLLQLVPSQNEGVHHLHQVVHHLNQLVPRQNHNHLALKPLVLSGHKLLQNHP